MRALAAAWPESEFVPQSVAQIPWGHIRTLLDKLSDPSIREWYAAAAVENGWSRGILALQIDGHLHERAGRAVSNFKATLPAPDSDLAQQATKDPYVFDFLGMTETRRERKVEAALVQHMSRFLLELGQGFAFVGQQVRLVIADEEFYCDLLFYHLKLRRYVVIELKAVAFQAEFLGQLGMYQAAVDDLLAGEHDQPTIGLLLCRTKNDIAAEYALRSHAAPTGVAEWQTEFVEQLPDELAGSLPSVEEIEAELADPVDEVVVQPLVLRHRVA